MEGFRPGMHTLTIDLEGDPLVADLHVPPALPDAPPVLLIHGWGGSGRYWRDTIARLGHRFALIVPDLPGVGRSLPVRQPRDLFDQVAAVERLLAALHLTRVHVVGHSMGSGMAIVLAARRPELVERLVLTSISLFRSDLERAVFGAVTEVAGLVMAMRAPWMADVPLLTRQSASRYFYQVPDDPELLRAAFLDYLTMDQATAVASARSASSPEIAAAAARIQAPTLLVVTREDRLMPAANVAATAATIPDCRVRWFERCGHMPMIECADEYATLVEEFLCESVVC
ncbi:MAG: alpha/beta hydrolase [Roseiflexaceae bacterium]